MLGIALGTNTATDGVLLKGFYRKAGDNYTPGRPLYIGPLVGTLTTSAPGTGRYARICGYCINSSTDTVYFNPDSTWVET